VPLKSWLGIIKGHQETAPFGKLCTSSYQSAVINFYSSVLYHFRDIVRWRISWPWNQG